MISYSIIAKHGACNKEVEQVYEIKNYLRQYICEDIWISRASKEAIKYTRFALKQSDFIVAMGGSDIFHEVAEGLIQAKSDIPVLYIPSENNSDMSYNVNYRGHLKSYIEEAINSDSSPYDIYRFNDEMFCYMAMGGFLSQISYIGTNQPMTKLNYVLKIIKEGLNVSEELLINLKLDHKMIVDEYLGFLVTNTHSIVGFPVYSNHSLSDGMCEIMLIKKANKLQMMKELLEVLSFKKSLEELSFVDYFSSGVIKLELEHPFVQPLSLDRNPFSQKTQRIEVEPLRKIRVLGKKD